MQTLTYGLYNPDVGDTGWWDEVNANWVRLDGHSHNGTDSPLLTAASLSSVTQSVSAAGWGSVSGGIYSQIITMTSPLTYDSSSISIRDGTTKEVLYLKIVKASSNTFTVYSSDDTLTLSIVYR